MKSGGLDKLYPDSNPQVPLPTPPKPEDPPHVQASGSVDVPHEDRGVPQLPIGYDKLQHHKLPEIPPAKWPSYMRFDEGAKVDEEAAIKDLIDYYNRSVTAGYFQSHPYGQMHMGQDMKLDEAALANNYMKLVFGGKPDPERDNIDLAYNHALRQMAESPVEKDSLLGHQNPLAFVPLGTCDKDAILETFKKQRQFYKGSVDSDAERMLKTRPTHNLIATTCYGKDITWNNKGTGASARYNHVRGQADLLNRPTNLQNFHPWQSLSSKTFAPMEDGGEVPLNYENAFGADARAIKVTDEPRVPVKGYSGQWDEQDLGNYFSSDINRYMFNFADEANPGFAGLFKQYVPRM